MGLTGGYQNIQVLLTADNTSLKKTLVSSTGLVKSFLGTADAAVAGTAKWGTALKVGLAGGAVAAGLGLLYAVNQAVAFDKAMRNVNSLAGLGEKSFAALEKQVVALSTKLPQSATTLAEGLYDIQSSGFAGADAMKVLEAAALSASAGLTTTEVSARAIAATLNAYGLTAADAADVSDVLFQTVNAGVISFDELSSSLGNVVGGAAAAGVQIDEVGSAIAAMTLAGIGGAESVTSLNQLTTKLLQPSKALKDLYKDLGYESGESALKADGLRGVMEKLRTATGGNVTTLLKLFPEIRAARGALALMANDGKNYARTAGQIEDANARAGATQRVFNEQMKAAGNQLTLLKNQADAAAITVGLALLPAVIKLSQGAIALGDGVGEVAGLLAGEFGPGMKDLIDVVGNLWTIFEGLGKTVWDLVEPFAKLAVGGVAEVFNDLMAVLSPLTEMLAENRMAVLFLATALAVNLAGGAAAAATSLGYALVLALSRLLEGMAATAAGARALAASLIAAAPAAAVIAAITAGIIAWQSYKGATDDVKAANKAVAKSFEEFNLKEASAAIEDLQDQYEELEGRSRDLANVDGLGDLADDVLRIDKNFRALGLIDSDVEQKLKNAQLALDNFRNSAVVLIANMDSGKASFQDIETLMQDMNGINGPEKQVAAFAQLDAVVTKFGPKLKELGVDMSDGLDTAEVLKLKDYVSSLGDTSANTADAQQNLVDALGQVDTAMGDVEGAADALEDALDSLMGAAMGADEAGIKWRQGLADLKAELVETGGGIKGNSLEAGKNRLAIQDQVSAMQDLLVAQARNGAGAGQLTKTMQASRAALLAAGDAAGIHRDDMAALLRQYKLTPELVTTLIKENGGAGVKKMLRDIQREADDTGKKKPKIDVRVADGVARKALEALDASMGTIDGKKPKITPEAKSKQAEADLERLGKKADDVDGKKVDVPTSAPGADATTSALNRTKEAADRLDGKVVTVTTVHKTVNKSGQADGGYYAKGVFGASSYAEGGARLPEQARIQPGFAGGLIQWAEGETGGEAFIPLAPSKRGRSKDILEMVASRFGLGLVDPETGIVSFANGGVWVGQSDWAAGGSHASSSSGGGGGAGGGGFPPFQFEYKPFHFHDFRFRDRGKKESAEDYAKERAKARREYDKEKAKARRDYERDKKQARRDAEAEYKEQQALWSTAQGAAGTAGAYGGGIAGDPMGTFAQMQAAAEARARAQAELTARQSKSETDTADDYYKAPMLGIKDFMKAMADSYQATVAWGSDMQKVAAGAGADVVASLKAMGDQGEAIIAQLADGSVEQMQAMADQLRKIQMTMFQQDLAQDIAAQQSFQANLAILVGMGRADLASQLAEMGYQQAGGLAAAAVGMSAQDLANLAGQLQVQDDLGAAGLNDALALAALLQGSGGRLGIVGLSQKSGKGIGDVVGILQKFNPSVFSRLPSGAMTQVRADQALLDQGKQPSGLEQGGIVTGSQASRGLYYRWAEPGSGGESLIPLGLDRRGRAKEIWAATGRIIGAGGAGGGGSMVVVQPGAVTVQVDASGQQLSEQQVRSIANGAAENAMGQLAGALANGRR